MSGSVEGTLQDLNAHRALLQRFRDEFEETISISRMQQQSAAAIFGSIFDGMSTSDARAVIDAALAPPLGTLVAALEPFTTAELAANLQPLSALIDLQCTTAVIDQLVGSVRADIAGLAGVGLAEIGDVDLLNRQVASFIEPTLGIAAALAAMGDIDALNEQIASNFQPVLTDLQALGVGHVSADSFGNPSRLDALMFEPPRYQFPVISPAFDQGERIADLEEEVRQLRSELRDEGREARLRSITHEFRIERLEDSP